MARETMKIHMFAWKIEKMYYVYVRVRTCIRMGVDHVHTACLAQRNQDLLVRPYLSELLSTFPFWDISSYGNILALG